jgi:hypothetical protein
MWLIALDVLFWVAAVVWGLAAVRGVIDIFSLRRLPGTSPAMPVSPLPKVSVIVAARDEAARIETTVRRLLAQQGVNLEVIAVDDRSHDGTAAILERLAAEDRRLRVVRIDVLPEGWLGKCHACHVASGIATGDWLLFTDGDVWLAPDVIARAVRAAEAERADHVTLIPGVGRSTFLGKVGHLLFCVGFARRARHVNADRSKRGLGIGAFNLVRAEAYRAVGGHEALRLEVVEDVKLGRLLCQAGRRSRVFLGAQDVETEWGGSLGRLIKLMEKNHFAATNYRLGVVLVAVTLMMLLWGAAVVGPWAGTAAGVAAGLALFALAVPAGIAAVRLRWPVWPALVLPLFVPVMVVSLLNSAVVTLRQGGVRWRDTFYPLAQIRAGSVR